MSGTHPCHETQRVLATMAGQLLDVHELADGAAVRMLGEDPGVHMVVIAATNCGDHGSHCAMATGIDDSAALIVILEKALEAVRSANMVTHRGES